MQPNMVSRQCDILVYDQHGQPVVYADGPIKVVWPISVAMVVEVKTNFFKEDVRSSLENIESAKRLRRHLEGVIFAFRSPRVETVLKNLQASRSIDTQHLPTAILLFDRGVIIHSWGYSRERDREHTPGVEEQYAVRIARKEKGAVVVTFLLMLFFQAMQSGMLHADAANMLLEVIDDYTERELPDISIGTRST